MATKAYILIETAVGMTREVVSALRFIEAAESVDTVTGPYDIIVVVRTENLEVMGEFVTTKIHRISGVNRTVTCLVV